MIGCLICVTLVARANRVLLIKGGQGDCCNVETTGRWDWPIWRNGRDWRVLLPRQKGGHHLPLGIAV